MVYGDLGNGLLLLYPHCTISQQIFGIFLGNLWENWENLIGNRGHLIGIWMNSVE